jgi:hypothetical protein
MMSTRASGLATCFLILVVLGAAVPAGANTLYVAKTGSDSNSCSQVSPCASFNRAFSVAAGGDTVQVAAGSYSSQEISGSAKSSTVTFKPVTVGTVTLSGLTVQTSFVEVDDMTSTGGCDNEPANGGNPSAATHNTFKNISCQSWFIVGQDILVSGGNVGPYDSCSGNGPEDGVDIWQNSGIGSSRVTFDGVTIHDITDHGNECAGTSRSGSHVDCMQILAGHSITVRRSQFYNCPTSDIIARPYQDTLNDITIENNFMQEVVSPGAALNLGNSTDAIGGTNVVRYNVIQSASVIFGQGGTVDIYGNIMATGSCQAGTTFEHNVFSPSWSSSCGSGAKKANPSFIGPTPGPAYLNGVVPNFRLNASDTVAKDAGDSRFPATDIDGNPRPQGAGADAGAFEIGAAVTGNRPQPPTNLQAVVQ